MEKPDDPPAVPVLGLTARAGDSFVFGYVRLSAGGLTDLMNEHEDFEFADTHVATFIGRCCTDPRGVACFLVAGLHQRSRAG